VLANDNPITVHHYADAALVVLPAGELDLATAPKLERELEALLASPKVQLMIVDLRAIDFLDSTGLNVLVRNHGRALDKDRNLALIRGNEEVQRLLSVTGVSDRITVVDTPEELLKDR
jgi:anti-sigma B factor antagonist